MNLLGSAGTVKDVFERSLNEHESLRVFQVLDEALSRLCPCIIRKMYSCHVYVGLDIVLEKVMVFILPYLLPEVAVQPEIADSKTSARKPLSKK